MRRGSQGALPAVALTVFACLGVIAVLALASPSFRAHLPSASIVSERTPPRPAIGVTASPTPPPATRPPTSPPPTRRPPTTVPATRTPSSGPSTPARPPATVPPRCTAGSATVRAVADAFVDQASPSSNHGSAGDLVVASRHKERNARVLVRFALPALPSGCTLRSATLTTTAAKATGRRILASRASRAWSEASVTWANAPLPGSAAVAATVSGTTVRWTVTDQVASMRARGNYGFVLRDAAEDAGGPGAETTFAARTRQGAPVLVLRWS